MDFFDLKNQKAGEEVETGGGWFVKKDGLTELGPDKQRINTPVFFRKINGETPHVTQQLLDLLERNQSVNGNLNSQIKSHLSKNRDFFEKNLLLAAGEASRIDIKASTSDFIKRSYERHGYQIEFIDAKVIASSTGIPLHKKVLEQHQKYLAAQGQHPLGLVGETPMDPNGDQLGYYHIEKNANGHNVIYMNDIYAGAMVVDADGDVIRTMIAYKEDKTGNRVEEFMIPYKEPQTQNLPLFKNINYEKGTNFNKNKLFGKFSGLNFTDLGEKTQESTAQAFSGELENRKYSVLGDFLRAYEKPSTRAGFGGARDLQALQEDLAAKSLKQSQIGVLTSLYDQQAIIENLSLLHEVKQRAPSLYKSMLQEQQETAKAYLESLRGTPSKSKKILGSKVYGQYKNQNDVFEGNFESFLEQMIADNKEGGNYYNKLLEDQLQRDFLTRGASKQFLPGVDHVREAREAAGEGLYGGKYLGRGLVADPKRLYELEVGALKVGRSVNATGKIDKSILESYKKYIDDPFMQDTGHMSSLSPEKQENAIVELLKSVEGEEFDRIANAAFGQPNSIGEREESLAQILAKINEDKFKGVRATQLAGDGEYTLDRITRSWDNMSPLVKLQELTGMDGIVTAEHLKQHRNYRSAPLAITLRNPDGNVVGPELSKGGVTTTTTSLLGNIVSDRGGDAEIMDRGGYLATELDRRMALKHGGKRQFGATGEEFEMETLLDALNNQTSMRTRIAQSYGINPSDVDAVSGFSKKMAAELGQAGQNSALHQQIALKYDIFHRGGMLRDIQTTIQDIVSFSGGLNDAAVEMDPKTGHITKANPLNIRRMSSRYGLDYRGEFQTSEAKANLVMQAIRKFGGYISKNTGSGVEDMAQMSFGAGPGDLRPVGINSHYFLPQEQSKRIVDIQRQMANGAHLGQVRMALADTDIPLETFRLTDPDTAMGLKRADEGLVLISKSLRDRAIAKIHEKLQIGPTMGEDEFQGGMDNYIEYMLGERRGNSPNKKLNSYEEADLRAKFRTEFRSAWEIDKTGAKTKYKLTEAGKNRYISRVFKIGSYLGDKAVVHTVDDMRDAEGGLIDILMHVNQARSRGNHITRMQQVLQTSLNEGTISLDDLGEDFRDSASNGMIGFQKLWDRIHPTGEVNESTQAEFMGAIEKGFIDPLKKSQKMITMTDRGESQAFHGLLADVDDFFATGAFGDVYKSFDEPDISLRSISKLKLMGKVATGMDKLSGMGVGLGVNAGIQFGLHTIGSFLQQATKATVVGTNTAEHFSSVEMLKASRRLVDIGRDSGRALSDNILDMNNL